MNARGKFCTLMVTVSLCLQARADTQLTEERWGTLADGSAVTRYTEQRQRRESQLHSARCGDRRSGSARSQRRTRRCRARLRHRRGIWHRQWPLHGPGTELKIGDESFQLTGQPNRDGTPGNVVLHGGPGGFSAQVWTVARVDSEEGTGMRFTLDSPDGDQGFPGRKQASVTYHWTNAFELIVSFAATTTKPTVVSLTQHSYFNLAGAGNGDIMNHLLQISADFFTFALPDNKPTGEIRAVQGTPFDFTVAKPIGRDIESDDPQMQANRGYNQNFVLRRSTISGEPSEAAVVKDPASGRVMTVMTTEPGLFLYTANLLDTRRAMKGGVTYPLRAGVALETGRFPDSPNQPHFPSTTLLPGETWHNRTVFAFSVAPD